MGKTVSNSSRLGRRGFLGSAGAALADSLLGSKGGGTALFASDAVSAGAWQAAGSPRGLPPLKITDVRVIVTRPDDSNYVVVKILTCEPGLYGVGDATFDGTELAVVEYLEKYVVPLLIGRDPEQIEDTWSYLYQVPYWRSGPVQMTALAGIDTALWDIKGKRANMPVYQLLGGRTRTRALTYGKAAGTEFSEIEDGIRQVLASGYKCCRAQIQIPGSIWTYRKSENNPAQPGARGEGTGALPRIEDFDPSPYLRTLPRLFEDLRTKIGPEVEFLHDVHERLDPVQAARLGACPRITDLS
jgi:mannonate dehydratase